MPTVAPAPAWSYVLHLPHDPRAPRVARMTLRAALAAHGPLELLDAAELLTSELVTNAYRHTSGPAALRVRGLDGPRHGIRVGVWDTDPRIPPPFDAGAAHRPPLRPAPPGADHGRGLHLVRLCADAWGGFALGDDLFGRGGKLLWFEVVAPGLALEVVA
ncbi:ATP-binding protein [Streptomyces sp. NPDC047071]|uniref:ATP-binding protein n=1 Tax=Streptomyces sp. NPDC047071 TaxID=3154808 RepID=UPI003451B669